MYIYTSKSIHQKRVIPGIFFSKMAMLTKVGTNRPIEKQVIAIGNFHGCDDVLIGSIQRKRQRDRIRSNHHHTKKDPDTLRSSPHKKKDPELQKRRPIEK